LGGRRLQQKPGDQPRSTGDVAVKLPGVFPATAGGERLADSSWRLRKGRELVKLLALAPGHRLHREQLMDALWPGREPAAAANNLNQVVHAARRALGANVITLREELLTLHAGVDVDDFERAAAHARRAGTPGAYRAALSLYAGELLPENRYDDWAGPRREELDQLRVELEAELDALGSEDRPFSLPPQASSFVGRDHELRELKALLARTRLLTLAGTGGAGKTRLALELARETEDSYANGAALVELASVGEGQLVAAAAAAALDVGALPGRSPLDGLIDFLAPRALLLLLDNCEHVMASSAALVDSLLGAAPHVTIVATSREPLRVPGEVVFRVPSLAIPDPEHGLEAGELLRYEAVRLLTERAAAAAPGFEVDAENAADVARICFRLDGLPLALELAAARLGALGTATLAERLDDRFRLLRTGSRAAPTRQQTLAATLQWSHDLLVDDEKLLFRRLSAFAGGFELTAAEHVCPGDGLEAGAIVEVLARLVEKSLVGTEEEQGGRARRYQLLETVRLYAAARLEEAGERAALAERHARWALATVEREGDSPRLDREAANLRSAHEALRPREALRYCIALLPFWLRRIDLEEAHRRLVETLLAVPERTELRATALLAASAIDYRAGMLACGAAHAQESYEIATELADSWARWRAMQRLAEIEVGYDHAASAVGLLEPARELARREGFPAAEAVSVYSLGVARWLLGDFAGSEELLTDSAASFRALAASPERIQSPLNIAEIRSGDHFRQPGLRIVFEETLQPFVEITCDAAVGYVLANQATIARLRGEPERARGLLDEAAARFARANDERGRADVLVRRAYLDLAQASPAAARASFEQALGLRRRMGDRRGVGLVLSGLGLAETLGGDHRRAEQRLAEARVLFRRAGDRWGLVSSLWRTADLALARERLDDAEAALEEARGVVGETERQGWIAVTFAMLAEVARLRGDAARAASLFGQARQRYLAAGDERGLAAVEQRMQSLAKERQSRRKEGRARTTRTAKTKRRQP
jgi:predicted ATPase